MLLSCLLAVPAAADSVTDTIGVYVGYYGWSEDEYLEKATYHWTELDDAFGGALDTHTVIYSYYSGSRTYLVAARGFYIRDLFSYAGIDFGSIGSVDFFTKDHSNGAYRSFTRYSLFDMPRYYYPNLAANEETGEIYAYDGDDIWNGASTVEAMLALEDFTEWDVPGAEFEQLYDPDMMSANARFHLFFGQAKPSEASTSSAAKYCYKVLITFLGTPVLSTEQTDMELKIGSGHRIEVSVDAEDGLLNDYVKNHITWSSSDESVVSVAPDGTIEVRAEGEAVVTGSFGESSVSVSVRASADGGETETGAAGSGEGSSGSGEGTAEPDTPAADPPPSRPPEPEPEPEPEPDPPPEEPAAEITPEPEAPPEEVTANRVVVIDAAALAGMRPGSQVEEDNAGGRMDEDSEQLVVTLPEKEDHAGLVAGASAAALAVGFGWEILRFKRLLRGKRI